MVRAAQFGSKHCESQRMGGDISEKLGPRRCSVLIVDNPEFIALASQPEHRACEIVAAGRIDPACAQDEMFAAACANQLLAFELGTPIGIQRTGRIVLGPRLRAGAIEHVVSAVVHQPRSALQSSTRQCCRCGRIDGTRHIWFALSAIYSGVRRRIHDDVRPHLANRFNDLINIGQIATERSVVVSIRCDDLSQWRECALDFPANLAVLAEKEDFQTAPRVP